MVTSYSSNINFLLISNTLLLSRLNKVIYLNSHLAHFLTKLFIYCVVHLRMVTTRIKCPRYCFNFTIHHSPVGYNCSLPVSHLLHLFPVDRIPDAFGRDIEKACQSIYPLHDVFIRKVKVLKKPKFDSKYCQSSTSTSYWDRPLRSNWINQVVDLPPAPLPQLDGNGLHTAAWAYYYVTSY